jgi:hypothetical protein
MNAIGATGSSRSTNATGSSGAIGTTGSTNTIGSTTDGAHDPARAAPAPEPAPSSSPSPAAPADALAEETRLLRDADAATRAGDATRALALLAEHARRFPRGALAEERDAETVLALCAAGRTEDARAAARRFLAARPGSALAGRVRSSCGGS